MTPKNKEEIKKRGQAYWQAGKRKAKRKNPQIKSKNKSTGWLLILIIILLVFLLMIESVQIFLRFNDSTKEADDVNNQQPVSPVYIVDSESINFDVYLREHFANKVPKKTMQVTVSAYSSTNSQTDDTPYLTAFGTHVRDGIVAANFLPVGTVIRFPDKFGDNFFVVEDRMNERFSLQVDIWMSDQEEARRFGIQYLKMEIF